MVRCLLLESSVESVPPCFLSEGLTTTVHLINRLLSLKLQNQIPYSRLFKTQPNYTHLQTFGFVCSVHFSPEHTKLSARCVFLWYASHKKGFLRCDPQVNHIRYSCFLQCCVFLKSIFFPQHPDSSPPATFQVCLLFSS